MTVNCFLSLGDEGLRGDWSPKSCGLLLRIGLAYKLRLLNYFTLNVFNIKRILHCFVDSTYKSTNLRMSSFQPEVTNVTGYDPDEA